MALLLVAASMVGCVTVPPVSTADTEQAIPLKLGRVQTLTQDGMSVQLAIPTEIEVSGQFGVSLAARVFVAKWLAVALKLAVGNAQRLGVATRLGERDKRSER